MSLASLLKVLLETSLEFLGIIWCPGDRCSPVHLLRSSTYACKAGRRNPKGLVWSCVGGNIFVFGGGGDSGWLEHTFYAKHQVEIKHFDRLHLSGCALREVGYW